MYNTVKQTAFKSLESYLNLFYYNGLLYLMDRVKCTIPSMENGKAYTSTYKIEGFFFWTK